MSHVPSAATLLREARSAAGLTQVELALLAGVTQSVISAYENGHRQPSLETLALLVESTGSELAIATREPARLGSLRGTLGRRVRRNRSQIKVAAARHGASNVRVFGSVARGDEQEHSDLDVLVDLSPNVGLLGLASIKADIEAIVHATVDVVPASNLKPSVAESALREALAL